MHASAQVSALYHVLPTMTLPWSTSGSGTGCLVLGVVLFSALCIKIFLGRFFSLGHGEDQTDAKQATREVSDPGLPDPTIPPAVHYFTQIPLFTYHRMNKKLLSRFSKMRPAVLQSAVMPTHTPTLTSTSASRSSSISQHLCAAKEILQGAIFDEYVWGGLSTLASDD